MIYNNIKLAWHFQCQEFNHSHQRLLRWVQITLMIFVVTLSLSSQSIQGYLQQNLQGLLGADFVISQKQKLSSEHNNELNKLVNKVVTTQQIQAILSYQGKWQQAQLKAVGQEYPLQGELLSSSTINGQGENVGSVPLSGEIWLDTRLISGLGIKVGDQLTISDLTFTVSRVLLYEPDRLMEGHSVAMRAMINKADMKALNFAEDLIQYRYLLALEKSQFQPLIQWQQEQLPGAQVLHKQGAHPLAMFWKRTENFLGLASIILFFMAAIAIEQLAQVHIKKEQFFTALCMSLGATKSTAMKLSVLKWVMSITLLLPAVVLLSAGFHYLIIHFLNNTFPELVWQLNLVGMVKPIISILAVFAIFQTPVWVSLLYSSVAKQLTGRQTTFSHWISKLSSILVLFAVAFSYSDNGLLTFMMLTAIAITIALMILVSWLSLTVGEKVTQRFSGLMPFTLFMMKQRIISKTTQIMGVGLCAFLLLFTLMLLKDIGYTMSAYQRQHDGNLFVSQADEEQISYIQTWASEHGVSVRQAKPYMQAKVIKINQVTLNEFTDSPSESLATLSKSIRLHMTQQVPVNNEVIAGTWWSESTSNWQQVSVEEEVMTDIGLNIGDQLTLYINNKSYNFTISASHVIKPGKGSITFWIQMPASALAHIQAPIYNMASLELKDEQWPLLGPLWQKYPTLRMVSLQQMTELFDNTLAMVTKIVSGFAFMIILLSTFVILATIKGLESKEKKKNSVIMSFGFSRSTCLRLNILEWLSTAGITAIGAVAGTYIAGLLIYQSQFSLTYHPNFLWLLVTISIILSLVTSLGVYASKNSLKSSIRSLLAE